MKYYPYGKQYLDINDAKSILRSTKQNLITTGVSVALFEKNVSKYLDSKYATSCSSGTAAIHLAMNAINLKKNDVVVMPAINFIAAYSVCSLMGAKIYLADVNEVSGQMTPKTLIECIKKNKLKKIKAVVSMYLGGYPDNVINFWKFKKKYNFYLIEDACHAFGAKYKYKDKFYKIGSCKHSDIATFSTHPVKTFTTGEGGIVTTNNKFFDKKIKMLRSHGLIRNKNAHWDYNIEQLGFNYRLSDINCALGISQLKKVKKFIKERSKIYKTYKKKFNKYSNIIKLIDYNKKECFPSFHLLLANIDFKSLNISKNSFFLFLRKKKIFLQFHYIPIYKFSAYNGILKKLNGASKYELSTLSLPIYYGLKEKDIIKITSNIINILNKFKINKKYENKQK
jgi:dTDP-4-amino-4,6-dideoxygalactose transaminase